MNQLAAPQRSSRRPLRVLVLLIAVLAAIVTLSPVTTAQALQSTGHGRGHLWAGDGTSWLGTYRLADGRFAFCLEVGKASPVGHDYVLSTDPPGLGLSATDLAKLAFISRTWAGTTNADTAAAAQLAVWSITGLDGRTLSYYAGRANGSRDAVLAKAHTFIVRAAAEATTAVAATVTLKLGATGTGTIASGLTTTLSKGGTAQVAAGTHSGTITLAGAKFGTGQATSKSVANGRSQTIRATGFGPTNTVRATVSFGDLPYRSTVTVGSSGAGTQKLLFTTAPTTTATKSTTATAVSPRPFSPRVVTATSATTAEAGAEITDKLTVSVKPVVDQLTEWGVYAAAGTTKPIPVTVRSTLLGPFATQPKRSSTWPSDAPVVCAVATKVQNGPGVYRTKACTLPSSGYFVWVESIDPADTPIAKGRDRVGAWKSAFATATEVSFVPSAPTIRTTVDGSSHEPGACVPDTLIAVGFPGVDVPVESLLLGPFSEAPAEGTDLGDLESHPVAGRAQTVVSADGTYRSPCIDASEPGHYVYVFRSEGSAPREDGSQEVPAFADLLAHDDESFAIDEPSTPETPTAPPTPRVTVTPPVPVTPPMTETPSTPTAAVPPTPESPAPPRLLAFTGSVGAAPIAAAGAGTLLLGTLALAAVRLIRRVRDRRALEADVMDAL